MLSSLFFLSAMHCFPFVYALLEEISCRKQTRARFLSCFYILHICCWFHAFPYCRYRCILYQIISSAASSHILQKPSEQPCCSLPALPPYIVTPPPFSLWFSSISFLCVWTYAFCRTLPVCYRSSSNKAPLFIRGALVYVSHSFFQPILTSAAHRIAAFPSTVSIPCFQPFLSLSQRHLTPSAKDDPDAIPFLPNLLRFGWIAIAFPSPSAALHLFHIRKTLHRFGKAGNGFLRVSMGNTILNTVIDMSL